ncbi:MAG TPA: transglycosylase family protein [Acidimicrobiales bacterium]|jgi:hypothetical protein
MAEWTDDDVFNDAEAEADQKRRKDMRRAIFGGAAALALLLGPIVLAKAVVAEDDSGDEVEATDAAPIAALRSRETDHQADQAKAAAAASVGTTTTAPPPPETTTTEPPTTTPTTEAPAPTTTVPTPPPTESDPPPDSGGGFGDPYSYETWDALAQCESGGNWSINTGNGYYGGIQFSLGSWRGVGGEGYPHENSRETQIEMGIRLYESSGWGAWPACTRKLGLR